MADRFFNKLALLAKIEAAYGTDSIPTGAANAMLIKNVQFTPLEADEVSRELYKPYFGSQEVLLAAEHCSISFSAEFAGSGVAGTAPAWGPLMRASGWAEVVTEDTDTAYTPVSGGFEAVSQYFNLDGVLHKFVGARGNVKIMVEPKKIPTLDFSFTGLLGALSDTVLPDCDFDAFAEPLIVGTVNTPVFSLHGYSAIGEKFEFDTGNKVEMRNLIGEDAVRITDRQAKGSVTVVAGSLASKNWFNIARAKPVALDALAIQHGTVAGNIVEIAAPKVQIGKPAYGNTQNIVNYTLPLTFVPDEGNDEITITVR